MLSSILATALLSTAVSGLVLPRNEDCQGVCGSTSTTNYTVVSGDTLTTIAQQFGSGICDIASVNNIANPNLIFPGENLIIPVNCTTPDNTTCITTTPTPTETCVPGLGSAYGVRSGDTLSAIATNFNITLQALEGANPQITNPDSISVSQIIHVPVCPSSVCETVGTYIIKSGDTFFDLANTYHTTVGQIEVLNVGVDPTALAVGQQVILPSNCHNITAA